MPNETNPNDQLLTLPKAWDLFVKWHIAFYALNMVALGFASRLDDSRIWVCVMFAIQNLLSVIAIWYLRDHSKRTMQYLVEEEGLPPSLSTERLTSGVATCMAVGYMLFMTIWVVAIFALQAP